jgi:hypothetical protein
MRYNFAKLISTTGLQKSIVFFTCLFVFFQQPFRSQAQVKSPAGATQEVWPEIDAYYKLNPAIRLMALGSATKANTYYQDGALGLNADFFMLHHLRHEGPEIDLDSTHGYYQWFRLGVKYSPADSLDKGSAPEYTLRTESNTRFYPGWKSMLTLRNRFDFVDKTGFVTVKYMPRLTWEKNFRTTYLNFDAFVYAEYYLYFSDAPSNRTSAAIGVNLKVSRLIVFQTYYLYQFEHQPKVGALNAIGFKLIFFMPLKKP